MGVMKAYVASDDEHSVVVFGDCNNWSLRERAASEMCHGDSGYIESIRRAPHFDQYAPGPVPISALLDAGWWYMCQGCERRVEEEMHYDDEDAPEGGYDENDARFDGPAYHVFYPHSVWCSSACRDADRAERFETMVREADECVAARDAALARFRGITIHSIERRHWKKPETLMVHFRFPGMVGQYGLASWTVGQIDVFIPRDEVNAWYRYEAEMNALTRD